MGEIVRRLNNAQPGSKQLVLLLQLNYLMKSLINVLDCDFSKSGHIQFTKFLWVLVSWKLGKRRALLHGGIVTIKVSMLSTQTKEE